jgi:histidyl-tRNA synthetase
VFRNEKPGPGRFRQFMQFDADTVGSASMAADAEMCMMAADTMEALGIPRGSYVVKVNNRKVLDGVLEAIGLDGDANLGTRLTVLRAIDKLDRLGIDGVRALLGEGRKDDSGDFTKGAGLNPDQVQQVLNAITSGVAGDIAGSQRGVMAVTESPDGQIPCGEELRLQGMSELRQIQSLVRKVDYDSDRIRIDPSVVRGLEYYTGPVYEVELLLETKDEHGHPVRFGSVGGGGRYDGLVSRFRGEPVPATGFSIGVSRLMAALTLLGKVDANPEPGPIVVTVFDQDRIADYQRMVQTLRAADIRAELYLGSGKMGQQLKYADKRRSPCVVIQGGNEKEKGEVQIKDLVLGAELAGLSKDHEEYRHKQAEAQFGVSEADLVAGVRKVLARHAVTWEQT